jgi:hypothetical protein
MITQEEAPEDTMTGVSPVFLRHFLSFGDSTATNSPISTTSSAG